MMSCKNILITGGAGFIGSNFICQFLLEDNTINIVNLDCLTYAGNLENLKEIADHPRYQFVEGNIGDAKLVKSIFETHQIDGVIHFAAESHVDNSIHKPESFIKTNIEGTFVLLDEAKRQWLNPDMSKKTAFVNARFLHISTDEVYGTLGEEGYFTELTPYAPNSPYSASKASSDFLVRSYFHTYGLNVVTSNCSNNYGPKQHDEKLIPTVIRKALSIESIPIYGTGINVRDWLYVEDHCSALRLIFDKGIAGETYLIGGNNEHNNLTIANKICGILDQIKPKTEGSYKDQIAFVEDRLGHDYRYAIDATKIKNELGWSSGIDFDNGLKETVKWYLKKYPKV